MFPAVSGMSSATTISSYGAPVSLSASHPRRDQEEYFLLPTTIFSMTQSSLLGRRTADARARRVRARELLIQELVLAAQVVQLLRHPRRPLLRCGEHLHPRPHRPCFRAQRGPLAPE